MDVARAALADGGPVDGVGIANQRASSIVWDRVTGVPVAPGIGWQDLRTVGTCLVLQAEGIRLAPNASATKVMAILDAVDPERARAAAGELCFGTVDSWVAWTLSGGPGAGRSSAPTQCSTPADWRCPPRRPDPRRPRRHGPLPARPRPCGRRRTRPVPARGSRAARGRNGHARRWHRAGRWPPVRRTCRRRPPGRCPPGRSCPGGGAEGRGQAELARIEDADRIEGLFQAGQDVVTGAQGLF